MSNLFFEKPILNSPYDYPSQHWELDDTGQPTQKIVEARRSAEFITPIPKPKKRKANNKEAQADLDLANEVSDEHQQYHSAIINGVRAEVDKWRSLPNPSDWGVTPETARLLQHWRHHNFSGVRPFFCQVEAVETAIWLTEVAPKRGKMAQTFLDHLQSANDDANPGLMRLALKLATGAGKTTAIEAVGLADAALIYDTIIIGAGLSGLAAGIRLAYYEQRVCILERHYTIGGLNSFYRLRGRDYDVGLHAVTNFTPRGTRTGPLSR